MKENKFATLLYEARRRKKLNQDQACKVIGIGDSSSLSKWENGLLMPSEEMVLKIMRFYNEPLLGYFYLQEYSKIGEILLPPVTTNDFGNLVLRFQKEYNDIEKIRNEMIDIACDGIVEEQEKGIWKVSKKELIELVSACIPLVIQDFSVENKKPLQDGRLERAYA